jgi:hemerythrin-like domain-containing protein
MLSQAQKTLKDIAARLANGTAVDKNAIATFTVQPFSIACTHARRLLSYLESVLKNIDFAASQMDRMLREHQALARINSNFNSEGLSALFKDNNSRFANINNSTEIRTRNRR